ncbi:FtsX-like permease family protein [Clostridium estertheticum]|uniref:ABC transporter permease n=1 Tax=Clostridium estertheticum TaxID=238834 RepID=UPI001CF46872|nr:FtsX-like permease family protein [Clostridium estertheticum]MCB2306212.1 FtsX-like permease family protein [Clostridium estertheticum]MCB2344385.1 FtsX-like permease family protein [Clostridium estertheticum]MCB2349304.1 FtsX-like permease family protein [Clostridium estertheticum]WAG45048.1 FtsX-like permease family protein [Clostridium estertheticum]
MKFENNNKEVIKRITNRSLKTNKIRNIFAILAIVLTTFMISSVFSIGISFIKNYKIMNLRIQGTTASVALGKPTKTQINKIKDLDLATDIGYEINAGRVDLNSLTKNRTKIIIKNSSLDNFEKQSKPAISNIKGKYPTEESEVMASRRALEFLGKSDAKIGDKIEVQAQIDGKVINKAFILSGIYTTYDIVQDTGYLLVSESFIKGNGLSLEEDGNLLITLKESSKDAAPKILKKEVKLIGQQEFSFKYDITDSLSDTAIATAGVAIIIVLFIVLSGYLLIYNVLYIAVNKDINFYGLLKTIGTSPKQIKKIVKGQALRLSLMGIPIGLVLGAIVSFGIVPMAMRILFSGAEAGAMPTDVSFNPFIFLAAALFSLLTVILSCRKPAKIAGNISEAEALRYTGANIKKKKERKTTNGGKLYKMAWYNIFREKKRAIIVFLSLFMGIITFLSVSTFLGSVKVENYINKYVKQDFTIQNIKAEKGKIDDTFIEKIKSVKGVNTVYGTKTSFLQLEMNDDVLLPAFNEVYKRLGQSEEQLKEFLESTKKNPSLLSSSIIGIDDNLIERIHKEAKEKFDIEAFKKGELILIESWSYGDNYKNIKGDLTIKNTKTGKEETYPVQIFKDNTEFLPPGLPASLGLPTIYMSTSALEKLDEATNNYILYIDGEEKYEPKINMELKKMSSERGLWFESKSEKTEEFNKSQLVMSVLGGGISIILILIGILNFINIMITGVNVRLKELAIMESIGMTKKQIKKMLTFEGLYYAGITTILILTVGMTVIYGVGTLTREIADYAVFTVPAIEIISVIIVIFIVCLITPAILFTNSTKKSVTERIRGIE